MVDKIKSDSRAIGTSAAYSSFSKFNSASRLAMTAGQCSQMIGVLKPDVPFILNGYESDMLNYTTAIKMPVDGTIEGVVCKYRTGMAKESIKKNSIRTVLFVSEDTGELDVLHITTHSCNHDVFGHLLHETPIARQLRQGMPVREGTVLACATTHTKEGLYASGVVAETCYLSDPSAIEDGVKVSETFAKRSRAAAFTKATGDWGSKRYPVNTFGDENVYKPFPSPGEKIREDGLVLAMRSYSEIFDAIDLLPELLMRPDLVYDQCVYAPVESENVEVLDVEVITTTNDNNRLNLTPVGMEKYTAIFTEQTSNYYSQILDICENFKRVNRNAKFSKATHRLMVEAYGDKPKSPRSRYGSADNRSSVRRTKRGVPLDEWHVSITLQWELKLGLGAKIAGRHGNKGVFCSICPDEDMPISEHGVRAEVVVYGPGVIARTNSGQLYEQFINAAARDVAKDIAAMLEQRKDHSFIWQYFIEWMQIASKETYEICARKDDAGQRQYLKLIADSGIYLVIPEDNDYVNPAYIRALMNYRMPDKTPVTFRNFNGEMKTTKVPVLIGCQDYMILDKSFVRPMASAASSRLNAFGLPSVLNKTTRTGAPVTLNPPRTIAESEQRGISAAIGGKALMDILEVSTTPEITKDVTRQKFTSKDPSNMRDVINRKKFPHGKFARPTSFVSHLMECMGAGIGTSK